MATATLSPERLRADFPLLADGGPGVVYLDSAATSQKPASVLAAMDAYYREANANVHRGVYGLAVEATDRFESARDAVAGLVGVDREQVVFTKNASEALNLMAWAWGVRNLDAGDEILVTAMEHHSNIVPWHIVSEITGATVRLIPVTPEGELDLDAFRSLLGPRTKVLATTHVSNVLGTINPVAELAAAAHDVGALVVADGAQSVPHMPVDFGELGADALAFTGHKMLGPTGIGVLVARRELLETMEPFLGGGEMISRVTAEGATWNEIPWKFEAGTPPIAEAVGLGAAVRYLTDIGLAEVRAHEIELTRTLLAALGDIPGLTIYGPTDPERRGGAVSFALEGIHPHDLAQLIDRDNVCVRAGHHCAQPLMESLGTPATTRASVYLYNSDSDVDALVKSIHRAREFFGDA
jgi:cysteine desulfurase/selenocysteine lyase